MTRVLEFQLQHHSLQRNPRADLLQNGLVGSPCGPRDSKESSPTPQFKASILQCSAFSTVKLSHPYMTTGKTIALTRWTFFGKVMSLLFSMLSQFSSVAQSCPTLCCPMNRSTPGLPVHHQHPNSLRLMSIESVMPSSHFILCCPLLLLAPIPPSIRVFSN